MVIGSLLVGGLLASGQVSAQEAAQLTHANDVATITMSFAEQTVDWLAASEASKVSVGARVIEAASCATGGISMPQSALQARAFIQAVGRVARARGVAIEGLEQIHSGDLLTEVDERAVTRLPAMAITEKISFKQGDVSVTCVLVSGELH